MSQRLNPIRRGKQQHTPAMAITTGAIATPALAEDMDSLDRIAKDNSMPRALIIAYYFPPLGGGGTQRTLKFVRYLPDFGWEPHVLTVRNSHYLVTDKTLKNQISSQTRIIHSHAILPAQFFRRITNHETGQNSSSRRRGVSPFAIAKKALYASLFVPDEYIGWYPFAVRRGMRAIAEERHDIIFSTGPPNTTHLIARKLARRTGLPWIADLRDLWDMYPDSYNPFHWRWRHNLDNRLEASVLHDADRLIVVSTGMRRHLLQKYTTLRTNRVHVITNGFDPDDFAGIEPVLDPEHFTIVHAGTLFPWRPLRPMLQAMQKLFGLNKDYQHLIRLKLLGIVPENDRSDIRRLGLTECVEILGYQPYHQNVAHLLGADLLLLLVGNIPHAREMLPGKIFDYIGCRRPILAIGPEGDARQMVRDEQLGLDFSPRQVEKIAAALAACLQRFQYQNTGIDADFSGSEKFHRKRLTRQLTELFELEYRAHAG